MSDRVLSLDGTWEAVPTADDESLEAVLARPATDFRPMPVPSNWHIAGLPDYDGTVWFRRRFRAHRRDDSIARLRFHGVDYIADAWLNGRALGHHEGYFDSFELDVQHALREGDNDLLVRVTSPREDARSVWPYRKQIIKGILSHHDCRPGAWHPVHGQSGNTGGIWNHVELALRSRPCVDDLRIDVHVHDRRATILVRLELGGIRDPIEAPLSVRCLAPDGTVVARCEQRLAVHPTMDAPIVGLHIDEPELWYSWDHGAQPLYTLEVVLGDDRVVAPFGVRTVRREGDAWFLNDRRIFLRGTNAIPALWLSTYDAEQAAADVLLMREAGINIVRVHAHVGRRELYEACDAAGLMVWQDFALQWSYDTSPGFAAEASRQIRRMVRHLRRHPSIVAFCCHNEPVGQEATLDPLLVRAVRAEADDRIVRTHSDFREHPYEGWYYGHVHEYAALPGGPLVTEFGAQALPCVETLREMFSPADLWPPNWAKWAFHDFQYEQTLWIAGVDVGDGIEAFVENSQRAQADLLRYAIDRYRRARYAPIVGIMQFMFVDAWPSITWSVVDHRRRPKLGYHVLKEVLSPVYLSVRLKTRVVRAGQPLPVDVVLVNDFHRKLDRLTVAFEALDTQGRRLRAWQPLPANIGPDSAAALPTWDRALDTDEAWRGDAILVGTCHAADETLLSRVEVRFRLEQLPDDLAAYKAVEMP